MSLFHLQGEPLLLTSAQYHHLLTRLDYHSLVSAILSTAQLLPSQILPSSIDLEDGFDTPLSPCWGP